MRERVCVSECESVTRRAVLRATASVLYVVTVPSAATGGKQKTPSPGEGGLLYKQVIFPLYLVALVPSSPWTSNICIRLAPYSWGKDFSSEHTYIRSAKCFEKISQANKS